MIDLSRCTVVLSNGERFNCTPRRLNQFLKKQMVVETTTAGVFEATALFQGAKIHDRIGEQFYNGFTYKHCVVCGSESSLTRHHIVPKRFSRHLPKYRGNCHDLVLLCRQCHDKINVLERVRYEEWLQPYMPSKDLRYSTRSWKKAIERYLAIADNGDKLITEFGYLPDLKELKSVLQDIKATLNPLVWVRAFILSFPNFVDLERKCRAYFVAEMRPRHLPERWSIDFEEHIATRD